MASLRRRRAGMVLLATLLLGALAVSDAGLVLDAEGDGGSYSPDEKTLPGCCLSHVTLQSPERLALRSANVGAL